MYERPELIPVGKAEDIVLGIVSTGFDIDMQYFPPAPLPGGPGSDEKL